MDLIIENVRCFHERQQVPIRPLTLLVGENSSGKTTFLACYRIAAMLGSQNFEREIDFNDPPFELGSFDEVSTAFSPRRRAKQFAIGIGDEGYEATASFERGVAQPRLAEFEIRAADKSLRITIGEHFKKTALLSPEGTKVEAPTSIGMLALQALHGGGDDLRSHAIHKLRRFRSGIVAIAPIRSKPERVYSRFYDEQQPGGEHLAQALAEVLDHPGKTDLVEELFRFGEVSGLFSRVQAKRLGSKVGDPLRLMISNGSNAFNITDVGYGVSQALPMLLDSLDSRRGTTLLVQQPEVHLHPRAQAQLGTLFANVAKAHKKTFIVETHSDHLVDRVRMDIRDKITGLKPDDVALLFFERTPKNGVKVHRIEIDSEGNIVDPPESYRSFFAKEDSRFFGVPV